MYQFELKQSGYRVSVAYNGETGLQMAEDVKPDLILLDLRMPVMSGDEMLKELCETDDCLGWPYPGRYFDQHQQRRSAHQVALSRYRPLHRQSPPCPLPSGEDCRRSPRPKKVLNRLVAAAAGGLYCHYGFGSGNQGGHRRGDWHRP